uniref:Sialate O-acetylesterase domain-containing protein n=1 Tax=uncultured Thiotrichaceae bacterium TaxID=298394 RepID=A0A6S6SJK9_9GAMM|nr:MAG: Unknown protein [uncultured Thiotrichaceae bacterium]
MKIRTLLSYIAIGLLSSPLTAKEHIYLMAGQSNMMGLAHTKNLPASYRSTPPNVSFFYKGSARPLARGTHIGPEVSFAHTVARAFPNDQHTIIKFAATGSHIRQWFPGETYYEGMIRQFALATSQENPNIDAIFWMQGEGDAFNHQRASTYARNLTYFINVLRKELNAYTTPFIMGFVDPTGLNFPEISLVQQQQHTVNKTVAHTHLIPAEGVAKIYDNIHFNALGQVEMGKRFALKYIDLVKNQTSH